MCTGGGMCSLSLKTRGRRGRAHTGRGLQLQYAYTGPVPPLTTTTHTNTQANIVIIIISNSIPPNTAVFISILESKTARSSIQPPHLTCIIQQLTPPPPSKPPLHHTPLRLPPPPPPSTSTCVTPLRSILNLLMIQFPEDRALSRPYVMVSMRMHLAMSNWLARLAFGGRA